MINVIANNLAHIQQRIGEYEKKYAKPSSSVRLLAVSKGQSLEKIHQAMAAGQHYFGENYLQEALDKITTIHNNNIAWHFIGQVQSNKTRKIAEHFSWVHSVCDPDIAQRLNDQRPPHLPPLSICIQVKISQETAKAGAEFDHVLSLAEYCATLPNLRLRGLMAIPVITQHFIEQRAEYYKLRLMHELLYNHGLHLDTLSMGMTHDMEAAIAENSNMVRIGSGIFGDRK